MKLRAVTSLAAAHYLDVMGGFHVRPGDGLPEETKTLLMFGPREPGFWAHVTRAPEFRDGKAHALDRWSTRVVGSLAHDIGADPYFPFGGPPHRPFVAWALRTGRAWSSDVGLLVHDQAGLMISFRGALGLSEYLDLPGRGTRPCDTCAEKPCRTACPVAALTERGYDIPVCKTYLVSQEGQGCMGNGCAVRRACPRSEGSGRMAAQSAFHMRNFLG
ncbi:MAG: ferredoxin [Pseudomonadota bacterium]